MPRATSDYTTVSFENGFITETGPLGYPQNAAEDLTNLVLEKNGSVRVRNGLIPAEARNKLTIPDNAIVTVHKWENVGPDNEDFLVVQVSNELYVFSIEGEVIGDKVLRPELRNFSNNTVRYTIDNLTDHINTENPLTERAELRSVQSYEYLYMTSQAHGPFYLWYLPEGTSQYPEVFSPGQRFSGESIQIVPISLSIRDFSGVEDGLEVDERPNTLSNPHEYNIRNQGWKEPWIEAFYEGGFVENGAFRTPVVATSGEYPSNADIRYLGNTADLDGEFVFDSSFYRDQQIGNTRAPQGHYIINIPSLNRMEVSGISNLESNANETLYGPSSIAYFSQRVWYTGFNNSGIGDSVLFSQQLRTNNIPHPFENLTDREAGKCYQRQDPTAETLNDLLATDGGEIKIPGARNIFKIIAFGPVLLIFAENGVWSISGTVDGFSAENYNIVKVTDASVISPESVVQTDYAVFFWSAGEIYVLQRDQGGMQASSLTANTIRQFYVDIPRSAKENVKGHYVPEEQKVYWVFEEDTTTYTILIYDLTLQSFNKYSLPFPPQVSFSGCFYESTYNIETIDPSMHCQQVISGKGHYLDLSNNTAHIIDLYNNQIEFSLDLSGDGGIGSTAWESSEIYNNLWYLSTDSAQVVIVDLSTLTYDIVDLEDDPERVVGQDGDGRFILRTLLFDKGENKMRRIRLSQHGNDSSKFYLAVWDAYTGDLVYKVKDITLNHPNYDNNLTLINVITNTCVKYLDGVYNFLSFFLTTEVSDNGDGTWDIVDKEFFLELDGDSTTITENEEEITQTNNSEFSSYSPDTVLAHGQSRQLIINGNSGSNEAVFDLINPGSSVTRLGNRGTDPDWQGNTVRTAIDQDSPSLPQIIYISFDPDNGDSEQQFNYIDLSDYSLNERLCDTDLENPVSQIRDIYYPPLSSIIRNDIDNTLYKINLTPLLSYSRAPIVGMFNKQGQIITTENNQVLAGPDTVIAGEDNVVTEQVVDRESLEEKLVICMSVKGFLQYLTFDNKASGNYVDYAPEEVFNLVGADSEDIPYVEAKLTVGDNFFQSLNKEKQPLYVFTYFEPKESNIVPIEEGFGEGTNRTITFSDNYEFLDSSNANVRGGFGWASMDESNRVSKSQKAYRRPKVRIPDYTLADNSSFNLSQFISEGVSEGYKYALAQNYPAYPLKKVVNTKLKIRGKGESLNLVYENEKGKGFNLLAISYPIMVNENV